jgi:hypothetical protein
MDHLTQADETCMHINTGTTLKQIKEIPAETAVVVIKNIHIIRLIFFLTLE